MLREQRRHRCLGGEAEGSAKAGQSPHLDNQGFADKAEKVVQLHTLKAQLCSCQTQIQVPDLPLSECVTGTKSLNGSEPQSPYLYIGEG